MTGLQRILGVTRVARITGLDRTGVEVASAVRPLGHVLQVTNGKGWDFESAHRGAVAEAAELWAAERVDALDLVHASRSELVARHGEASVWDAGSLGSAGALCAPALWSQRTRIAWRLARRISDGRSVWLPAQAVHCPPSDAPPLGPAVVRWSSNGMGAHRDRRAAVEHAALEVLERDRLARALPTGFTAAALRRWKIDPRTLPPALRHRWEALEARGFEAHFLALDGRPPCAACLLVDRERGPIPLTAGYGCRRSLEAALEAALLEAAQSRLTDIHGAREDVAPQEPSQTEALLRLLRRVPPRRPFPRQSAWRGRLSRVLPGAAVADLKGPPGLHVVKVIAPGLLVSELL